MARETPLENLLGYRRLAPSSGAATGVKGWSFGVPCAPGRRSAPYTQHFTGRTPPTAGGFGTPALLFSRTAERDAVRLLTRLNTQTRLTRRACNFPGTPSAAQRHYRQEATGGIYGTP
jgi:hypothetical protein